MRFPLNQKIVGGYRFRQKTWYNTLHLGTDWRARYVNLYAPTDGEILKAPWGTQGGQWLYFEDNQGNIHRFGHLSRVYITNGKVEEGELIAKTGNSGEYTTAPHLHEDITKAGFSVNWNKISQFMDPEKFYQLKKTMREENENVDKFMEVVKEKIIDYGDRLNSSERKKAEKWIESAEEAKKKLTDCEVAKSLVVEGRAKYKDWWEKEVKNRQKIEKQLTLKENECKNLRIQLNGYDPEAMSILDKIKKLLGIK